MWYRRDDRALHEDSFIYNVFMLWKHAKSPIYVMDNHLCAAWCWIRECLKDENYNFLHVDYHHDLLVRGEPSDYEKLRNNVNIDIDQFCDLEYTNTEGRSIKLFSWDDYIRPCYFLFPNWFQNNLFYTRQKPKSECCNFKFGKMPICHQTPRRLGVEMSKYIKNKNGRHETTDGGNNFRWIVNIDLDFFIGRQLRKPFGKRFVEDIAKRLAKLMDNIQVLTIAISPGCLVGNCIEEQSQSGLSILKIMACYIPELQDFVNDVFNNQS